MRRPFGFTLVELMITIAIISVLAAIMIPNFMKFRQASMLTACCNNVRNIGVAAELYANANLGHYPSSLTKIIEGGYMQNPPICPSIKTNTYETIAVRMAPDAYTVFCKGDNHIETGTLGDYPQYTSSRGLLRKDPSN
jgi:prepilin-type N-terminal cleavage/methylation domain-containing protein